MAPGRIQSDRSLAYECSKQTTYRQIDTLNRSVLVARLENLKQNFTLDHKNLGKLIRLSPIVLQYKQEYLSTKLKTLQEELGWEKSDVVNLLLLRTSVVFKSVKKIRGSLAWATTVCQNDTKKVDTMITKYPPLLSLSVDNNLKPTLKLLVDRLGGLSEAQVAKVCTQAGQFLVLNFSETTEPKLTWLEETFELDQEELRKLVCRYPRLLSGQRHLRRGR